MKCPDLHRKVMYRTHTPLEKSGDGGLFSKNIFAGNLIICPDLQKGLVLTSTLCIRVGICFKYQRHFC